MRELARILSEAAGHGVRIATIWQPLGQMRERYGGASDTILANSTAQRFIGPITDDATRRYLVSCSGTRRPRATTDRAGVRRPVPERCQQLGGDRAPLVARSTPPAIVATRPWWRDERLRRRAT